MSRPLPIERRFELIEAAFGLADSSVPGTGLQRTLLSEKEGGGIGWCLSVGLLDRPKCFFYAKTIVGCFAKARNAARAGRTKPLTVEAILG